MHFFQSTTIVDVWKLLLFVVILSTQYGIITALQIYQTANS